MACRQSAFGNGIKAIDPVAALGSWGFLDCWSFMSHGSFRSAIEMIILRTGRAYGRGRPHGRKKMASFRVRHF